MGSIWIVLNVNIKIPTNHAVLAMLRMIYFVLHSSKNKMEEISDTISWPARITIFNASKIGCKHYQ